MIKLPYTKVHNSYILETYDYQSTKKEIKNFAMSLGFDETLVDTGNHPDIYWLEEDTKKISIEVVRNDIINTANLSPHIADKKIYIIYNSINLDSNTQNAMLKLLEEPPVYDIFFLVTSNANKLLETIRSRCIVLKDADERSTEKLLAIEYIDDALFILANAKNESASEIMSFAENFEGREDRFKELIALYRYVIRDAFSYKKTLSKELIILKEREKEIINIANAFSYEDFGRLIDSLDRLSEIVNLGVNKKIAVFNYLNFANIERI